MSLPSPANELFQKLIDAARYCQFTEKNPVATLEGISIKVLYTFFSWLLGERKGSIGAASSLQTYWNAWCLVRKQETGGHQLDPLIKTQMRGVYSLPHRLGPSLIGTR